MALFYPHLSVYSILTPINAMMAIFFDGNITGNQCNLTVAKMTDVLLRFFAGF